MSEFAENHMKKHGWSSGKGLGRDENGMAEPIKVKIKCDTAGVGHKLGEQFTNHWWDAAFKNASENIKVEHHKEGLKVSTKKKSKHLKKNEKKLLYGRFVKSAVLNNGVLNKDKDCVTTEDIEVKIKHKILTDDELLNACGGRTAHKGARHGLKLSGKLARLEAQENSIVLNDAKKKKIVEEPDEIKSKKRKKNKMKNSLTDINNEDCKSLTEPKKKLKKFNKKSKI